LPRDRADISLPPSGRLAVLGAGVLMVAMVMLLVAQLSILADSREHIVAQDRKINRLLKGTGPVLDEAEPLAADARRLVRRADPVLRDARPVLRATAPLVRDLRAEMVPLLRSLRGVDLRPAARLVDQGNELIDALRASEAIPRTLRAADLVPEITGLLRGTFAVQRDTLRVQRRTFRVNRQSRDLQRQALLVLQRSLAVQEEALVHVRSIDRKTGGTAPGTGAPVPAAPR
jgi:hypothetical protein